MAVEDLHHNLEAPKEAPRRTSSRGRSRVRQGDIKRAVRGIVDAGVSRFDVLVDAVSGTIRISVTGSGVDARDDDADLDQFRKRHGYD